MPSMLLRASRVAVRAACSAVAAASRRAAGAGSAGAAAMPLPRSTPVASPLFGRYLTSRLSAVECLRGDAYVVGEDFGSLGPVGREPFVVDDKDLESDEALWALYERWCKFWGEERSHEEMQRRFGKFKRSVLFVDHFNKKAIRDGNSCRLEVNMFSDEKLQEERLMHLPMTILDRLPYSKSPIFGRAGHRPFSEGTEEVDLTEGSEEVDFTKGFK